MNKHSYKQLHRFLLLWGSQTVSQLGTAMTDYAVIIWVYSQRRTASSVTLLTVCTFLPTIFFRFLAGSMVDRQNKKCIMLIADLLAACGTLAVFVLHSAEVLQIWHLYVINFLLSLMNAFQEPASFVAVSLLVPKEHYARAGGLQGFGGAAVFILAPALGALLLACGGLDLVLMIDLATFAVAFLVLLFLIRIPEPERQATENEPFSETCLAGIRYLKDHTAILRITLFLAVINFLAKLGNDGMISPFILGRTGNNQAVLGMVESFTALGVLAGSLLATLRKPGEKRIPIIFITACPVDYQQNDEDSAGMHRMFEEYGIGFERFCVVDARMEPADAQKWAREADCFFLMVGGVCAEQMQLMRDKGIYDIVRDGPAMVLGVSAGSMNMGKTTVDIWESMVPYEGLGFADITMIGHFSYEDTERLRLMKAVSMERPVCAM